MWLNLKDLNILSPVAVADVEAAAGHSIHCGPGGSFETRAYYVDVGLKGLSSKV